MMLPSELQFVINRELINVTVILSSAKPMALRFNKKLRRIEVIVPEHETEARVRAFISPHLPRFNKFILKVLKNETYSLDEGYLYVFGKRYLLKTLVGFSRPALIKRQQVFYLQCHLATEEEFLRAWRVYATAELNTFLARELPRLELALGTHAHTFSVMSMRSSWGVNYVAERRLGFHVALAHYQAATIKYVMIHELAHDFELGHTSAFWALVKSYEPSLEKHRAILRLNKAIDEA